MIMDPNLERADALIMQHMDQVSPEEQREWLMVLGVFRYLKEYYRGLQPKAATDTRIPLSSSPYPR